MRLRKPVIVAIGIGLSWIALGQTEDEESARQFREMTEARSAAQQEEALKRATPKQREDLRRYNAAVEAATTTIIGKDTPELVPYETRMAWFFARYDGTYKRELEGRLSKADQAILDGLKPRLAAIDQENKDASKKVREDVAARGASMSAVEIAAALRTGGDRLRTTRDAVYLGLVRQLSTEGQATVNQFAYEKIRPNVSKVDVIALAQAEPEMYKQQFLLEQQWKRQGGKLPVKSAANGKREVSLKRAGGVTTLDEEGDQGEVGTEVGIEEPPPEE